jgi:hypothetical protein
MRTRRTLRRAPRDEVIVSAIAALRISLGVGALLAPAKTARLFGFPAPQQTAMARLLGRWFGARELVLAGLALAGHGGATPISARRRRRLGRRQREFAALNAVNDAIDAAAMVVPLVKREHIDRPQLIGIPIALAVSAGWLTIIRRHP